MTTALQVIESFLIDLRAMVEAINKTGDYEAARKVQEALVYIDDLGEVYQFDDLEMPAPIVQPAMSSNHQMTVEAAAACIAMAANRDRIHPPGSSVENEFDSTLAEVAKARRLPMLARSDANPLLDAVQWISQVPANNGNYLNAQATIEVLNDLRGRIQLLRDHHRGGVSHG